MCWHPPTSKLNQRIQMSINQSTDNAADSGLPATPCSASWFLNGAEYRERNGYIEARNSLNPDWVVVDKAEPAISMPNETVEARQK